MPLIITTNTYDLVQMEGDATANAAGGGNGGEHVLFVLRNGSTFFSNKKRSFWGVWLMEPVFKQSIKRLFSLQRFETRTNWSFIGILIESQSGNIRSSSECSTDCINTVLSTMANFFILLQLFSPRCQLPSVSMAVKA